MPIFQIHHLEMALPHSTFPYNGIIPFENSIPVVDPALSVAQPLQQSGFVSNGQITFNNPTPFIPTTTVPQWQRPPEITCLSDTMSELAISDCAQPPPNKIRRRNAITIQDPNPSVFQFNDANLADQPQHSHHQDAFESSFLLQRMEELQKRLGGSTLGDMKVDTSRTFADVSPPPPSPDPYRDDDYPDFSGPVKRKVPSKSQKQKEIDKISLHADLASFKPRGDLDLPDSLLRRYRANKCNALVLYQPPIDLVAQLREQENNNFVNLTTGDKRNNDNEDVNEPMTE